MAIWVDRRNHFCTEREAETKGVLELHSLVEAKVYEVSSLGKAGVLCSAPNTFFLSALAPERIQI